MKQFSFGLLTDIQYADRPMQIGRYYRNALYKTNNCIDALNRVPVDFCVHLGDLIDWPGDPEKGHQALSTMISAMKRFDGPMYYLLGNHDVDSVSSRDLAVRLGMLNGQTWYAFNFKEVHFIALDCNFDASGSAYQPGSTVWDQCYIPDEELQWLESDLQTTRSKIVVILVHALLDDMDNPHVIKNAAAVRSILEASKKRLIVFQGHMHSGHESMTNGICYHTLRSIVDGRTRTCYWVVEVDQNEIVAYIYDSVLYGSKPQKRVLLKI